MLATGKIDALKASAPAPAPAPAATPASTPPAEPAAPAAGAAGEGDPTPAATDPNPTPAPAADPDGEETTPAAGEAGEGKSKRFRFSNEADQAIAMLAKSKGITLLEAAKLYEGQAPAPAATPAPASEPTPQADPEVEAYDAKLADIQTKITDLAAKRKAAAEDLDNETMLALSDEIADLKADHKILTAEKQGHLRNREQNQKASYEKAVDSSRDRVFAEFPAFAKADSIERLALDAYVNRAISDPKRAGEFKDPAWPERLAREFATKQGIQPKAAAGTTPAAPAAPAKAPVLPRPQPTQVQQPAGAKLLTGADGKQAPNAARPLTREALIELVRTNPEARRAIVRKDYLKKG